MSNPRPTDIVLHRASHALEVAFDSGERFTLPQLVRRQDRCRRLQRVGEAELLGDASCDGDRRVGSRGDHPRSQDRAGS